MEIEIDTTDEKELIEKLTEMNINDMKKKFHKIFVGEFPTDINELEDFLITSVAMCIMSDDTFEEWNCNYQSNYAGADGITFVAVAFGFEAGIMQIAGLAHKSVKDEDNRFVGKMIALMNCCEVYLEKERLNESNT